MILSAASPTVPSSSPNLPSLPPEDPGFTRRLSASVELACQWLDEVARVREPGLSSGDRNPGFAYRDWSGAIRGEYSAATHQWGFFCPYWHSSQAAKALLGVYALTSDPRWRETAEAIGGFLLRHRITDPNSPDCGLPLAFEDIHDAVNTSAILESVDGLLTLGKVTGEERYQRAALAALDWVARRMYVEGEGVFDDCYNPTLQKVVYLKDYGKCGGVLEKRRPLLDDAVFLKGYRLSGDRRFLEIFLRTAEHLLAHENPPGNWIAYGPCHQVNDAIHPRHAYWWGGPLLEAWRETGDERFRAAFLRSVDWYARALRRDGGFIRNTGSDFNTDSFGHATSGSACAAILFLQAAREAGRDEYLPLAKKALAYCMDLQFTHPSDPNLKGAILEKIHPPGGHDASPFHLRDLGTIFFIQAATDWLQTAS